MKPFLILVLALSLVQVPFIFSLDCNSVSSANKELCNSIISLNNLSEQDKLLLINNLDYKNNLFPDHFLVYTHNNQEFISHPTGINSQSKTFIKNAWSYIFTLMPSVLYKNEFYAPFETEVLTGFNHTLEIPNNYQSLGYPNTNNGDCKRTYSILQYDSKNKIYVNDIFFGEGKNVRINLDKNSTIKSNYSTSIQVKIDHYDWDSYCCRWRNGKCRKTCYTCDFSNSETKQESISIITERLVKFYPNNLFAEIIDFKQNKYSHEIKLNSSDSVLLKFKDSSYLFSKYEYSINSSYYPYNIYTISAKDRKQTKLDNLIYTNNQISVKDISNCTLSAYDFFNKIYTSCDLQNNKVNLSIKTNKTFYKINEKINVSIYPKNISVNLNYGNFSSIVRESILLNSKQEYNKIAIEYGGEIAERVIFVYDTSRLLLLYKIIVLVLLVILNYKIIKKFGGFP